MGAYIKKQSLQILSFNNLLGMVLAGPKINS